MINVLKDTVQRYIAYLDNLISAERFTFAAFIIMSSLTVGILIVGRLLWLILDTVGTYGYFGLFFVLGILWIRRSLRKQFEDEYEEEQNTNNENETGVS